MDDRAVAAETPSWQLVERVGMAREARTIADGNHHSGRWMDGCAKLATEWFGRQA